MSFNNERYQRAYYEQRKKDVAFVSLQMSHEDLAALDAVAKRDDVARSEKIRTYIAWGLETDGAAV